MANYLFCHHQKTGGRSFIEEVSSNFMYETYIGPDAFANVVSINNTQNNVFITNHYPLSQRDLFTKEFNVITMLREPSTRLRSWWNHVLIGDYGTGGWWTPAAYHSDILDETDVSVILSNERFLNSNVNGMTRRLIQSFAVNHSDYKDISIIPATTQEHLAAAKEVLDNSIVGIFEQYEDSVNLFANEMNIELSGVYIQDPVADATNPFIGEEQQVNDANHLDYELWEYGKTLLASRLAQ